MLSLFFFFFSFFVGWNRNVMLLKKGRLVTLNQACKRLFLGASVLLISLVVALPCLMHNDFCRWIHLQHCSTVWYISPSPEFLVMYIIYWGDHLGISNPKTKKLKFYKSYMYFIQSEIIDIAYIYIYICV